MSDATDRILNAIDAGLQSSPETAATAGSLDVCVRCSNHPPADASEFCVGCRAWLRGDSTIDPVDENASEIQRAYERACAHLDADGPVSDEHAWAEMLSQAERAWPETRERLERLVS